MAKDRAAMARWLTDDCAEVGPAFPEALVGKRRFFARYAPYLEGELRVVSYRIVEPRAIALSPRLALVHFSYRMRTRSGGVVESSHGKESMLVERGPRGWRVRFIHWHRDA
jgi:hypothetical protein